MEIIRLDNLNINLTRFIKLKSQVNLQWQKRTPVAEEKTCIRIPMCKRFHEKILSKFEIGDQVKNEAKSREIIGDSEFTYNFIKTLTSLSLSRCFSPIPLLLHEINEQVRRFK